jgi:non-ribosomal peptide synthetase component E (peptide arylation enzyme)
MSKTITLVPVALQPGKSLDIRDGVGTVVSVRSGTVWITQADDRRDVFLKAGDTFTVSRPGLTLVAALGGPAAITMLPSQEQAFDLVSPAKAASSMEVPPWRQLGARYY